jgi:hypothetical protein
MLLTKTEQCWCICRIQCQGCLVGLLGSHGVTTSCGNSTYGMICSCTVRLQLLGMLHTQLRVLDLMLAGVCQR